RIDDGVAVLHHRLGEVHERRGDGAAVLADVAAEAGAAYVDAQAAFGALAGDGIAGEDLLLDHVHLTVAGQRALAELIVDRMEREGWPAGEGWRDGDVSLEEGVARLGIDARTALHPEVQLGFLAVFLGLESNDPAEHFERARRRFDRVLARDPDDPLADAGRAVRAVAEGEADEALSAFDRLHARSPDTLRTLSSMLDSHAALRAAFDRAGLAFRDGKVVRPSRGG